MSNLLSHQSKSIHTSVSNAWTSVLYSILLISGSELAETSWEKYFMVWLAEHDQRILGLGMVGIDFDDIYWSPSEFEQQKKFLISIAQNAIEKKLCLRLDYEIPEKELIPLLDLWIKLFLQGKVEDVKPREDFTWYCKPTMDNLDLKCPIHKVYLHKLGESDEDCCMLCNE